MLIIHSILLAFLLLPKTTYPFNILKIMTLLSQMTFLRKGPGKED
jgi:hypothetical protein